MAVIPSIVQLLQTGPVANDTEAEDTQPLSSVTETVQEPGTKFDIEVLPEALLLSVKTVFPVTFSVITKSQGPSFP